MKVICINDSGKPAKIPSNQWIKKGETYTIVKYVRMLIQKDNIGVELEEVKMDESCFPYEYYDLKRFAPLETVMATTAEEELVAEV